MDIRLTHLRSILKSFWPELKDGFHILVSPLLQGEPFFLFHYIIQITKGSNRDQKKRARLKLSFYYLFYLFYLFYEQLPPQLSPQLLPPAVFAVRISKPPPFLESIKSTVAPAKYELSFLSVINDTPYSSSRISSSVFDSSRVMPKFGPPQPTPTR